MREGRRAATRGRTPSAASPYEHSLLFPPLDMNNLFRGLIAGYGAKKLGGGCFSTILVFVIIWVVLGQCGATYPPAEDPAPTVEAAPQAPAPDATAQALVLP